MSICKLTNVFGFPSTAAFVLAAVGGLTLGTGRIRADDAVKEKGGAALPANGAVMPQYWLGVAVENIPPSFSRQLRLKENQGLMVVGVIPQTPAEKAGLKPDDLLVEINGIELTSQEQLARAANKSLSAQEKGKAFDADTAPCDIGYLRDGIKQSVKLMPQLRPGNMLVTGANIQSFTANGMILNNAKVPDARNYVLPNNVGVQVSPGYQFDLKNDASASNIRAAMKDGQTVVISQEGDANGNPKTTLSIAGRTYNLPDDMAKVPPSAQPLAQEFLNSANRRANSNPAYQNKSQVGNTLNGSTLNGNSDPADEQRKQIQQLLEQNKQLKDQLDHLTTQIEKLAPPTGKP